MRSKDKRILPALILNVLLSSCFVLALAQQNDNDSSSRAVANARTSPELNGEDESASTNAGNNVINTVANNSDKMSPVASIQSELGGLNRKRKTQSSSFFPEWFITGASPKAGGMMSGGMMSGGMMSGGMMGNRPSPPSPSILPPDHHMSMLTDGPFPYPGPYTGKRGPYPAPYAGKRGPYPAPYAGKRGPYPAPYAGKRGPYPAPYLGGKKGGGKKGGGGPCVCTGPSISATTLVYIGPPRSDATVTFQGKVDGLAVYNDVDLEVGTILDSDNGFTIDAGYGDTLGSKTYIFIDGQRQVIDTSCSRNYEVGMPVPLDRPMGNAISDWTVVNFRQENGNFVDESCGGPPKPVPVPMPVPIPGKGKGGYPYSRGKKGGGKKGWWPAPWSGKKEPYPMPHYGGKRGGKRGGGGIKGVRKKMYAGDYKKSMAKLWKS